MEQKEKKNCLKFFKLSNICLFINWLNIFLEKIKEVWVLKFCKVDIKQAGTFAV